MITTYSTYGLSDLLATPARRSNRAQIEKICVECGDFFVTPYKTKECCSNECTYERDNRRNRERARAKKREAMNGTD